MSAPTGNEFWKLRSTHGREKIFSEPETLWEEACKYFKWCIENPLEEQDFIKSGPKGGDKVKVEKMRAITIQGLCLFLGVNTQYLNQFEDSIKDKGDAQSKDFSLIITRVKETIYNYKFCGAAANLLNPNIIARDLGLVDKKLHEINAEQPLFPENEKK